MITHVTVGIDDIARAKRFYAALLPALGYGTKEEGIDRVGFGFHPPRRAQCRLGPPDSVLKCDWPMTSIQRDMSKCTDFAAGTSACLEKANFRYVN